MTNSIQKRKQPSSFAICSSGLIDSVTSLLYSLFGVESFGTSELLSSIELSLSLESSSYGFIVF